MRTIQKRKKYLGVYEDENGLLRCRGRIQYADLPNETKFPLLIPRDHHVTRLIVIECHERVFHNGVGETLNEFRTKYWLVRGRQRIKAILRECNLCKRLEGLAYPPPKSAPLPKFRVVGCQAFVKVGTDFEGTIYLKGCNEKSYICLFTCATSRMTHL